MAWGVFLATAGLVHDDFCLFVGATEDLEVNAC